MPTLRCPTCGREFTPDQTAAMPFCSSRCRLIDLGCWFNEEPALPAAPSDDEDDQGEIEVEAAEPE